MKSKRTYRLERLPDGRAAVTVVPGAGHHPYDLWTEHVKHYRVLHSPTGFEWGYPGSGPAELARAILSDFHGRLAEPYEYQRFKRQVIARIPIAGTVLSFEHLPDGLGWACVGPDEPWAPSWKEVLL